MQCWTPLDQMLTSWLCARRGGQSPACSTSIIGARYCPTGAVAHRKREDSALTTRSEEHTSELQSLMRISYAVFCLKKKNTNQNIGEPIRHAPKFSHAHQMKEPSERRRHTINAM